MRKKYQWNVKWILLWSLFVPVLLGCFCMPHSGPIEYDDGFPIQVRVIDAETGEGIPGVGFSVGFGIFSKISGFDADAAHGTTDERGFVSVIAPEEAYEYWRVRDLEGYCTDQPGKKNEASDTAIEKQNGNPVPSWGRPMRDTQDRVYYELPLYRWKHSPIVIPLNEREMPGQFKVTYRSVGAMGKEDKGRIPAIPEIKVMGQDPQTGTHYIVTFHYATELKTTVKLNDKISIVPFDERDLGTDAQKNLDKNMTGLWEIWTEEHTHQFGSFKGSLTGGSTQEVIYYYGPYKEALRRNGELLRYDYAPGSRYQQMQIDARLLMLQETEEIQDQAN